MGNTSCCYSCSPSQEDYQTVISKMVEMEEMSHIGELISYIDQLLNAIDEGRQVPKMDQVGSSINSGGGLLEKVLERSHRHICKRDIMPKFNREFRRVVINVTNQAAQIKWVGVAFSVVASVLEQIEQVSSNRKECIDLLRYMYNLSKYIMQLDEHLPQDKLNRVLQFIVKGCLMCISQMESDTLSKFFTAPVAAEDLRKFQAELGHEHQELSLGSIIAVLNRIPHVLSPSQGISPQAVGVENARNRVTELLNMEGGSVSAVVIYGQGGIGKTTLATAVFSKLNLTKYKYCRVDMEQNCSETDLKLLQHQILRDIFDRNIDLRSCNEGREELSKDFKKPSSQPVFIFVDNALKQSDLDKLLPITDLAFLPAQSRILLTTRNLTEAQIILQANIELHSYLVAPLQQQEARKLLCEFSLESGQENFDPTIGVEGLLQICQGVPLVLKIAGAELRAHAQNVQTCRDMVQYLKSRLLEGAEGEISECMVDFVYHRLDPSCKEAFLDIVFFFCDWEPSRVAFAVGEIEFEKLKKAALVNITGRGTVNVHDIVKARGRMLSPEGERIADLQSLTDVLQDAERTKKTKGICLKAQFELEASHLNLMKRCLRVLILKEPTRIVNGECKGAFENLRLLRLDNPKNYSHMDVSKHPRLAVFILEPYRYFGDFFEVSGVASSLKYMYIDRATLVNITTTLSPLQSLRSLALRNCRGFDGLPETIGNLHALEKLDLFRCSNLASLPDSFGNLSSLKELDLRSCDSLARLSNNFGSLFGLVELHLNNCSNLTSLPDSFGNLSPLRKLNLTSCSRLASLSDNFGCLFGLVELDLNSCTELSVLPDSFCNLSSLKKLDLTSCTRLVSLSDNFGCLCGLVELDLNSCTELSVLPESFGNLGSLEMLKLRNCEKLPNLPQNFCQLKCLKYVSICGCTVLQTLSSDFECLSSLIAIRASRCSQLEENTMDKLAKMKGLMIVDIVESPMLLRRWEQVKEQYFLAVVTDRPWEYLSAMSQAYKDVMCRVFFHKESKFVHFDENGQLGESPCPAVKSKYVKLCVLLTVCDLTSPSNSRYLEAVKRKWMEVGSGWDEEVQMMFVEVGSSWEESERVVRETLAHLPRGTTAWIAPHDRARLYFARSLYKEGKWDDKSDLIVSILTSVDEEGRTKMDFVNIDCTPDFEGIEYRDKWAKIFSPISEAEHFVPDEYQQELLQELRLQQQGLLQHLQALPLDSGETRPRDLLPAI